MIVKSKKCFSMKKILCGKCSVTRNWNFVKFIHGNFEEDVLKEDRKIAKDFENIG